MSTRLHGIRALVTRPAVQGEALCAAIRAEGGDALALPLMQIEPLPGDVPPLRALHEFDLAIFISANAARHALARLREAGTAWPASLAALAVGTATRAALGAAGIEATAGADTMDSEELLRHPLLGGPPGRRILVFRGEGGRGLLAGALRERGAIVTECALYRRRAAAVDSSALGAVLERHRINAVLAASGETLHILLGLLPVGTAGTMNARFVLVVPGQRVAGMATEAGFGAIEIAANATDAAMLDTLARVAPRLRTWTDTG